MAVGLSDTAAPRAPASAGRLEDIDRAKGLAITLVVLGHLVAREQPAGNEWYATLQFLIYSFHMYFFVYLAGVVFFYSGAATTPALDYWGYARRRAVRLLIPFALFGLIIVLGKIAAQWFLHVDNKVDALLPGLTALFWDTSHSPAESVWFVFVLFVYCAITPLLLRLTRGQLWPLLAVAAVAYCTRPPSYFYLDRISQFYVFFLIGSLGQRLPEAMGYIDRWFPLFALAFLAALTLLAFKVLDPLTFALCNLLSIPTLHGLIRRRRFAQSNRLLLIGGYSFVIYLLNTIFIGLTKGVLLKFMPWDGQYFLVFAPLLVVAGLVGPIALKELALSRYPAIDHMTD